jgi:hypothetical protein
MATSHATWNVDAEIAQSWPEVEGAQPEGVTEKRLGPSGASTSSGG